MVSTVTGQHRGVIHHPFHCTSIQHSNVDYILHFLMRFSLLTFISMLCVLLLVAKSCNSKLQVLKRADYRSVLLFIFILCSFSRMQRTYVCAYLVRLDRMTLIVDLDPDILKIYLNYENEVCRSRHSEVRAQAGQRDRFFAHVTLTLTQWPWYKNLT